MVELAGKRAIVTGAAVGIGNAYARALAKKGVHVAVCDVREEIDDLPDVLRKSGVESAGWRADVSNPSDVRRVVDGARDAFGGIDLLVNNAGACGPTSRANTCLVVRSSRS
jgi:NAD(P)-dependent dehydrogenase (short-subunit alcohol dehydrogenase family)